MKKVINGKVYDTEKAACVGNWSNGYNFNDAHYCSEYLYRKRTGEFFLHGDGGPMSKYAVSGGNNRWSGGEKIIPLTYEAAQNWAEEHLTVEEYDAIFGEVVEDDSRTTLTLSISASSIERAKRAASSADMSLSAYIASLIP